MTVVSCMPEKIGTAIEANPSFSVQLNNSKYCQILMDYNEWYHMICTGNFLFIHCLCRRQTINTNLFRHGKSMDIFCPIYHMNRYRRVDVWILNFECNACTWHVVSISGHRNACIQLLHRREQGYRLMLFTYDIRANIVNQNSPDFSR